MGVHMLVTSSATQVSKKVNNPLEPHVNMTPVGAMPCVSHSKRAAVALGNAGAVVC